MSIKGYAQSAPFAMGKSAKSKLAHGEGCRLGIALDARGRAREQESRRIPLGACVARLAEPPGIPPKALTASAPATLRRAELFDQGAAQPATRVIDHDVFGAPIRSSQLAEEACHLIRFNGTAGKSLAPVCSRQGCEFRGVAGCDDDAHAFAGKEPCERGAQSRAGAHNQRDFHVVMLPLMDLSGFEVGRNLELRHARRMPLLAR